MSIQAVIFDLFGTLVHEFDAPAIQRLMQQVHHSLQTDPEFEFLPANTPYAEFVSAIGAMYEDTYRLAARTDALSPRVEPAIHKALQGFGVAEPSEAAIARFIEHYAAAEQLELLPATLPALEALAASGLRLALLSNVFFPGRIYEPQLERLGIAHWLPVRVFSADERWMKPHPEVFRAAAAKLGVAPADCVMVGDREDLDIQGAHAAGMPSVLIAPEGTVVETLAEWVVPDLSPLPGLLLAPSPR